MSIFLLILKIIGIILISIIGLLLLLILLVLFVPIRYKITADKYEDEDFKAVAKLTWLLHFLNIKVTYLGELFYIVRVTLIPVAKSDNLKKKAKVKKLNKQDKIANINDISSQSEDSELNKKEDTDINKSEETDNNILENDYFDDEIEIKPYELNRDTAYISEHTELEKSDNESETENNNTNKTTEETDDTDDTFLFEDDDLSEDEKKSLFEKISEFFNAIYKFVVNIKSNIINIKDKIIDTYNNADYYISAVNDERNRAVFSMCFTRLIHVLKHIAPRKYKGNVIIGSEDAYNMGKMMSIYSILFPIIHDKIQMVPDYEHDIMEGDVVIKGRIRLGVLLWAAYKIYFNKDFKRMLRIFRRETDSK